MTTIPNQEQIGNSVRTILTAIGVYVAAKGWLPGYWVNEIVAILAIIIPAVWGTWATTVANQVASVKAKAQVENVITTADKAGKELAEAVPGPEVVSAAEVKVVPK